VQNYLVCISPNCNISTLSFTNDATNYAMLIIVRKININWSQVKPSTLRHKKTGKRYVNSNGLTYTIQGTLNVPEITVSTCFSGFK